MRLPILHRRKRFLGFFLYMRYLVVNFLFCYRSILQIECKNFSTGNKSMNKNRNKHILSISMATFQDCNMSCSSFVMLKFANMTCNHKYNTKKPLGNFPFKFKVYKKRVLTSYHFNENQISFLLKISSLFLLKHFFVKKKKTKKTWIVFLFNLYVDRSRFIQMV